MIGYCSKCVFWTGERNKKCEAGDCRRHAPIVLKKRSVINDGEARETTWPSTINDHSCGDFVDAEGAENELTLQDVKKAFAMQNTRLQDAKAQGRREMWDEWQADKEKYEAANRSFKNEARDAKAEGRREERGKILITVRKFLSPANYETFMDQLESYGEQWCEDWRRRRR